MNLLLNNEYVRNIKEITIDRDNNAGMIYIKTDRGTDKEENIIIKKKDIMIISIIDS